MRVSISGRVVPYFINASLLTILFGFITSILGNKFFFLFLISFALIPILMFLFREKKFRVDHEINSCCSPCDGTIKAISSTPSGHILVIQSSILDLYQKKSPVFGKITKIIHSDNKNENYKKIEFEITNSDGVFKLEIMQNAKILSKIDVYVCEGDLVKQGDDLCFVEFFSKVKLSIPGHLKLIVNKDSEIITFLSCLAIQNNSNELKNQ